MKVRHLRHLRRRARPAPKADMGIPTSTRCDRCHIQLIRPPIRWQGLTLGPRCAQVLGYVPPAKAARASRRAAERNRLRTRARAADQPDLFDCLEPSQ